MHCRICEKGLLTLIRDTYSVPAWGRLSDLLETGALRRLGSNTGHDRGRQIATLSTLQWRHNERDGVSNHQPHDRLLKRLFRRGSKKTSKLRVTGLCEGNSSVAGEFPAQRVGDAEDVSIWWRHHWFEITSLCLITGPTLTVLAVATLYRWVSARKT